MLRQFSAIVTAAAAGAAMLLTGGGQASADALPPVATPPGTCSGVIGIDALTFDPAVVPPGGTSDAALTATNCTGLPQSVTETWTGRFTAGGTGIPAGCPVIDPLARPVTFAPSEQLATTTGYLALPGCTADRLTVTVAISQDGVPLAERSADLLIG